MQNPVCLILVVTIASCASAAIKTDIEYAKPNGVSQMLDASVPETGDLHPIAILVHGGGWSSGDKAKDFEWLRGPLSDSRFTWFSINYRLAPKDRWPACLQDVQAAIRWVKANAAEYKGDPTRIALIGYSAGGQLVCMSAILAGDDTRVQAIVGAAAPTDLELDLPTRGGLSPSLQNLLDRPHELTDESRQFLRDLSAVNFIKPSTGPGQAGLPPFLLIHGTADKSVPYQGSLNFQAKLKAVGVPCELITLPGAPHDSRTWDKFDTTYKDKAIRWLNDVLKNPAATRPPFDTDSSR